MAASAPRSHWYERGVGDFSYVKIPIIVALRGKALAVRISTAFSVTSVIVDQCMSGQVGPSGLPVKKTKGFLSNSAELLEPLRKLKCNRSHQHESGVMGINLRTLRL